jgi:hypothetical protein
MRKIYFLFSMLFASVFSMAQITFPLDFEGAGPYTWTNFGEIGLAKGAVTTVINNPQSGGINTSAKVAQTIKGPGGEPYAGSFIQFDAPMDFSTLKIIRMKVFSKAPGLQVLLKVENKDNAGINSGDVFATTTLTNAWEDLSFNFTTVNVANSYQKLVVIFRLGQVGDGTANFTFHFDDVRQEAAPVGALTVPTLPVTFESATVDYTFVDFDGGSSTVIANPQKSGINTSDTVARLVKGSPGVPSGIYAGSKLPTASAIDLSPNKVFRMKVFSPRVGAKVRLKLEGGAAFESPDVLTTKANEWEDMTFTLGPINNSNNQIVIFFDILTAKQGGPDNTFLVDDIRIEAGGGGGLTQMNVPVTFDDATVNYGLIGFGGTEGGNSAIVADPTNAANKVARVIKPSGAQDWAGTTVSAAGGAGFSAKLPFAVGSTFMNVRVWSPLAGIPVRLKVEDSGDKDKSVETEATTTVANGWQNLVFNFANKAPNTADINFNYNYNKASIFFNFGPGGATVERTYYFDDMVFGADPLPVKLLSFNAEKANQAVQLSWTTTNEVNNKEFGVQRSETGEKWNDIAVVKGQGTSNGVHTYSAEDKMPLPGVSYYRLRQTDLDGASVYSKVKVIDFSGIAMDAVKVYPNPAKGRLNVIANTFDGKVGYTIVGVDGRQVGSGMLQNTISATGINISNLKAGMYILKLQNNEKIKTVKFMVQ